MEAGLVMLGGGVVVGIFGSLLGLGGGILIVPLLTIGFGLPVRDAVGVSLVCVIMTSGASASVYLERKVANLRLGMLLELFTATGAVIGGAIAFLIAPQVLEALFAILLAYTALTMLRAAQSAPTAESAPALAAPVLVAPPDAVSTGDAAGGDLADATVGENGDAPGDAPGDARSSFVARLSPAAYRIRHLRIASGLSVFAGVASALLGIGGGLIKVPVMHLVMGVPLRVATATSNLMIGITGSTSAIVYFLRGGINPIATAPTAVGVFVGASIGSRIAHRVDIRVLRWLFVAVLLYTAFEMAQKAMGPA